MTKLWKICLQTRNFKKIQQLVSDKGGRRGAYLCANEQCLAKARKTKQLERALETAIPDEVYEKLEHQLAQGSESV